MVVAFIPVRGGSKSIPLKNIKSFCGKPLVYWNIKALEDSDCIDKIIVATDSVEIENAVRCFQWHKTSIYQRDPENASDTASTESVMLEYISKSNLSPDDIFILVQATSPLTEAEHFEGAFSLFNSGKYDSIITCVRNKRFFWNDNGTPINYDYHNRPRRQNFDGMFMENGAFYINTVKNVMRDKNRLSGRIGIYEMPEYTATEIDEPDDWIILENLMRKYVLKAKKSSLKLFISDVDGVLTDGGMYYSENGDELKKFNTKDGMAFSMLHEKGIYTAIITSENTKIVENRAKKMNIDFLVQGKKNGGKLAAAKEICDELGISLADTAFVGDDINDIELLKSVGYPFCPADAQLPNRMIPNIQITQKCGGDGVIREIVDDYIN